MGLRLKDWQSVPTHRPSHAAVELSALGRFIGRYMHPGIEVGKSKIVTQHQYEMAEGTTSRPVGLGSPRLCYYAIDAN
jgi:hypothetical protein